MLRSNCSAHEKMAFILSPTSIEWPLQIIDDILRDAKSSLMPSVTSSDNPASVMEKPAELQQQQQLKCPRCDSSNTKFCYYNNYSLSQPRHFCKACKRYWTRGGTLRNVPVGGGCRKNKRVKRPISSSTTTSTSAQIPVIIDAPSSSSNPNPSLFYALPQTTNPNSELNLQLPYNNHPRVTGYDLHPHMNGALGLGFSSSGLLSGTDGDHGHSSNSSIFSGYNIPVFGSSSRDHPSSSTPTMTSLLASSLQQQRFMGGLLPFDQENSMPLAAAMTGAAKEDVKMELGNQQNNSNNNRSSVAAAMDWSNFQSQLNNQQGDQIGSADPNFLLWNTAAAGIGVWQLDPTNIGSSVPSLI